MNADKRPSRGARADGRGLGLLAAALVLATSAGALAQEPETVAQALFGEGRRLMKEGQYAAACPKLAESYRLDQAGGTSLNLALCYESNGQVASAWTTFKEALGLARKDKNAEREAFIQDKINALEPRLPKIAVKVAAGANVAGVKVMRDSTALGAAAWGLPMPVDPGEHTIMADAPGYKHWETKVTIAAEPSMQELEVPALVPDPTAAKIEPKVAPGEPASDGSARRTGGFVVGGVGIASVIVGAVFGGQALSKKSASDKLCGGDSKAETCVGPASDGNGNDAASLNDTAKLDAKLANAFIFGGIAVAALGTILVVTAPRATKTTTGSLELLPAFGPNGAGMTLRGGF